MFVVLTLLILFPPMEPGLFTPARQYIALESQKVMLFEYGQPFKLHRRSRAELYNATVKR